MSRSFKESRRRHFSAYWKMDRIVSEDGSWVQEKTTKPKKRKELDTEDHWMSTPSWWVRLMMGRPERRQAHTDEKKVLKAVDIEDFDFPNLGHKPHIYYW